MGFALMVQIVRESHTTRPGRWTTSARGPCVVSWWGTFLRVRHCTAVSPGPGLVNQGTGADSCRDKDEEGAHFPP